MASFYQAETLMCLGLGLTTATCAKGQEFESQRQAKSYTAQQRLATASTSTQVAVLPWSMSRRWTPQTRYTLRRNTASIMKGWLTEIRFRSNVFSS